MGMIMNPTAITMMLIMMTIVITTNTIVITTTMSSTLEKTEVRLRCAARMGIEALRDHLGLADTTGTAVIQR